MPDQTFKECRHLSKLLKAEIKIMRDHISEHKWFNHIEDENKGMIDFIEKYGWLMREMYCGFACPERENCEMAKTYIPKDSDNEEKSEE